MKLKKKYEKIKEWFLGQDKYQIRLLDSDWITTFELRDLKNKITVGWFDTWWDAAEFCHDIVHDEFMPMTDEERKDIDRR